ncbi:MAG TPA: carbohydrate ABC transporter permease [Acetobacteraceae bacterium]|jgi:multiple sugar transport system permease protein|nr:carbohydrate ABC transporter permease [Acetobacteraceae bacterium]
MKRRRSPAAKIGLAAVVALVAIYALFPLYWMIISGLRDRPHLYDPKLTPGPFALSSYNTLFGLTDFPTYFMNSVFVSIITTILTVLISVPMAYALVRSQLPGRMLIVRSMLFAYMFPALLLALPIDIFLVRAGLDGTLIGLSVVYLSFTLPLSVWLLWSFFKGFPFAIEEAALVDGCTRLQAVCRVILPIISPAVVTVTIFAFLLAWSDFVFSLILITNDSQRTVPFGLVAIIDMYDTDWGVLMAGATLASIPLIALFMFLSRYFVTGLSMGAVK